MSAPRNVLEVGILPLDAGNAYIYILLTAIGSMVAAGVCDVIVRMFYLTRGFGWEYGSAMRQMRFTRAAIYVGPEGQWLHWTCCALLAMGLVSMLLLLSPFFVLILSPR